MPRKKTIAELEAAAKAAEERARKLREKATALTKAQEAKANAEIIRALREWHSGWPKREEVPWESLPEFIRTWTEKRPKQDR